MTRFQCSCGMVMSTPAGRARCLRCRKLLGWHEQLADTPAAPVTSAATAARGTTDEVSQLAMLRSIVSTLASAALASPLPRAMRPPHHARLTTTISVLLSRPPARRLTTTD
jgi:hypothetical protein